MLNNTVKNITESDRQYHERVVLDMVNDVDIFYENSTDIARALGFNEEYVSDIFIKLYDKGLLQSKRNVIDVSDLTGRSYILGRFK